MLERQWRIVATGLCFSTFGILGLIATIILLPLTLITPNSQRRQKLGKRLIKACFKLFLKQMQLLKVLTLETHHLERLPIGGTLVLANHPSLIDIIILISIFNNPDCVIKTALLYNPCTMGILRFAGFIRNEEGLKLIEKAIQSIENGNNLIIFPEGTRTKKIGGLSFKRGASNIAIHGKLTIAPVLIATSVPVLQKGDKWYDVPNTRPVFSITALNTIQVEQIISCDGDLTLKSRNLTRYLEHFFKNELVSNERIRTRN